MSRYVFSLADPGCCWDLLRLLLLLLPAVEVEGTGSLSDPELVVWRRREEGEAALGPADEEEVQAVEEDVVDFLLEERLTLVVRPLKQRDSSAAALFVKLTSADIPAPVEPVALFQAARKTTRKQARI